MEDKELYFCKTCKHSFWGRQSCCPKCGSRFVSPTLNWGFYVVMSIVGAVVLFGVHALIW